MTKKLKRAVIKEELVALTGDMIAAVLLNQMLYWSERTRDSDQYIAEEKERDPDTHIAPQRGWIYKTAKEILDETMLGVSEATIVRRMQDIVDAGWLMRRRNPRHKWDRTWQYRPDLHRIQADLAKLGYALDSYPLQIEESESQDEEMILQPAISKLHPARAIPEITSETTSERRDGVPSQGGSSEPPTRALSALQRDQNAKRKALTEYFEERTGIKCPEKGSRKGIASLWWNPIREMLQLTDWNLSEAKKLMRDTIERLDGLTITDPNSLRKTARAVHGQRARASPVPRLKDGTIIMPAGGSNGRR